MLTGGLLSAQPALVCPPPSTTSAQACDVFHFHVQMYRPDTRGFADFSGLNQFATQAACDRFRDAQIKRNLAVVDYLRKQRGQQDYEPDRFGPCHCDMTIDKTGAVYLNDQQRTAQVRLAEEVRLHVRERLLDSGLPSDSELVRGLMASPPSLPLLGGPKFVAVAAPAAQTAMTNSPDDLRSTKAIDTGKPAVATLDLPLADVNAPEAPQPPAVASTGQTPDAADAFISQETERIQTVLKSSASISDGALKSKVFEACMQRIQLLSNLRSLIEGSGSNSRLAAAARSAQTESDRLALVTKLFGDSVAREWSPKDAKDVILKPVAATDAEPERVLRDTTGKFTDQQKKRALYVLLARSQPTDEQQLWLVTVVDSFLR